MVVGAERFGRPIILRGRFREDNRTPNSSVSGTGMIEPNRKSTPRATTGLPMRARRSTWVGLDPPNRGRFKLTALATRLRLVSRDGGLVAGPLIRTPPPKLITDWYCRTVGAPAGSGGNWLPTAGARPSEPPGALRTLDRGTPR